MSLLGIHDQEPQGYDADPYPSRLGREPELLPRVDPVVHRDHTGNAPGPLEADQVAEFDRKGFLVMHDMFSPSQVAELDRALHEVMDTTTADDAHRLIVEPDSREIRSIFSFHDRPGPLEKVAGDNRLAGVARQLLGSQVYIHQSRVNRKPGFRGKDFQWHSDFETWHTEDGMPRMRCLSAVVSLTDNHTWNGPLLVMPGSHRWFVTCKEPTPPANHERSLKVQQVGSPDDDSLLDLYDECGIEPVTGEAGSVLFFDCNLMHASPSNISPVPRRNLFLVYNSVHNTLTEPFSAPQRRPEHIASRVFTPV